MSLINDQIQCDAAMMVDSDGGIGEPITYTPKGQSALSINAYVRRPAARRLAGLGQVAGNPIEVWVPNNSNPAIGVASVNVGGDTITFAKRWGASELATMRVNEIVSQDSGFWKLALA